jgi:hypothetical protein
VPADAELEILTHDDVVSELFIPTLDKKGGCI